MTELPGILAAGELGLAVAALVGVAAGAGGFWIWFQIQGRAALAEKSSAAQRALNEAQARRDELVRAAELDAQQKLIEMRERFERETAQTRDELRNTERRLEKREDNLDKKLDVLNTKEKKIEAAEQRLAAAEAGIEERTRKADQLVADQKTELMRISRLTTEEARALCLRRVEEDVEREAGQIVERGLLQAQETVREKARQIIIEAIQRYASGHACETTVDTVDVPSDDMKGRIIGREGRNIRAFEKTTGITVVVDDTPGIVQLTGYDPVRREIARLSLERLIKDGRIHPTRIEEVCALATKEVEERMFEAGKQAALETNVNGLNKKVIEMLGRLHFRASYGQNVLRHSVEVSFLCGMMAEELRLDGALARRCGLLHDIGKAMSEQVEGTHTQIGEEFLKRFNEHAAVLNAVAGHHGDVAATFPYTPLVAAADAISASRPGSRRDSLERYIKRLQELEGIATSFAGVAQAYAVEAGREVRVIVDTVQIDDMSSLKLARDIAKKIEESMTYPGEIKVTVLRELRAVEYAR